MGGVRGCWSPRSDPGLDWGVLVLVLEDTEDDPEAVEDELNGPVFDTTVLTLVAVKKIKDHIFSDSVASLERIEFFRILKSFKYGFKSFFFH